MKQCIWCGKPEDKTPFYHEAHIVPKSLGGQQICENVCDICNHFFGSHYKKMPSIETIIKETFNISRARFLMHFGEIGKNKLLPNITSQYFTIDMKKRTFDVKQSYKLQKGFQENICRQLKKGIYKMFLEEFERRYGNGLSPRYDFIREFARYDLSDYPVFYFERCKALIVTPPDHVKNPQFELVGLGLNYLVKDPGFIEFELLGHVFGIATTRYWQISFDDYIRNSMKAKESFFHSWKSIDRFNDVDFALRIFNED